MDIQKKTKSYELQNERQNDISGVLHWVSNNQKSGIFLTYLLMFFYMLPIFLISYSAWATDGFLQTNFIISWFSNFLNSSTLILADFHKLLFPIIAGISVVSLKDKPSKEVFILAGVILLFWLFTMWINVYFNMKETKSALMGLPNPLDIKTIDVFLSKVKETLITYFMMLIGINISNKMGG